MSKKNIVLLVLTIIVVVIVAALTILLVSSNKKLMAYNLTEHAVDELNMNSNMDSPYSLLTLYSNLPSEEETDYDPYVWESESRRVSIAGGGGFFGEYPSPDKLGSDGLWCITEIITESDSHNILGVKVGDDISVAEQKLREFKYSHRERNEYDFGIYTKENQSEKIYCKYNLTIRIIVNNDSNKIERIVVQLIDYTTPPYTPADI